MKLTQISLIVVLAYATGCISTGSGLTSGITSGTNSVVTKFGETGRAVKGQFSTMGTAVGSAFGKTKGMVTSAFSTPKPMDPNDPTALSDKPPVIGAELYVASAVSYEAAVI